MRVLLIEDEEKLAQAIAQGLSKKGYVVDVINEGDKAYSRLKVNYMDYDLVILDLMLPGMDGSQILKGARESNITTPILVLTARDEIDNKVNLLLSGADDYLVKPFSFDELSARMRALLRRPTEMQPTILRVRDLELNPAERVVRKDGKTVPLTLKEYMLLEYFMQHPGKAINREELFSHLWDFNDESFSNVVDVHIKNLRKKLDQGESENLLETVRGVGYRLKE